MNDLLKFDIYTMVEPKSKDDIIVLVNEALAELGVINVILDKIFASK